MTNFCKLLTGSDGFSGSEIIRFLQNKKIKILGVSKKKEKKNIIKWNLLKKNFYLKKIKIDWIIHTAAIHKLSDFKVLPK